MLSYASMAQKEAYNWYFGSIGLTFNTNKPSLLTDGKMNAFEGCSAISDGFGRILFYTDGQNLWDKTHTITQNGKNLKGYSSATHNSIFIPRIDSVGQYYLLTCNSDYLTNFSGGLYYSIIDRSINTGNGDIISSKKNILIADSLIEKFMVTRHANGRDFWVVVHKANNDTLCSYLITSTGISSTPVMTKTGYPIKSYDGRGQMKFSPDGTKLVYSNMSKFSIMASFDASNGKFSNIWIFYNSPYGLEFSPNSKFVYLLNPKSIDQYDAKAGTQYLFENSRTTVDNFGISNGMQLGPDGKIYFSRGAYLSVIHAPDSAGNSCRVSHNYIAINDLARMGLPSFLNFYLLNNQIEFKRNCLYDSVLFVAPYRSDYDSLKWNFGDSSSGSNNFSYAKKSIFHIYKKAGSYKVQLTFYFKDYIDTVRIVVPIKNVKPDLGNDTIFCNNFNMDLFSKRHFLKYQWNTGDKSQYITITKAGTYILNALDSSQCLVSDTIVIKNPRVKSDFNIFDSAQCLKGNKIKLFDSSTFISDIRKKSQWYFSDGSSSSDSFLTKSFKTSGIYTVKLVVRSQFNCADSLVKTISIFDNTQVDFTINKPIQCFNQHSFDFINTSYNNDSLLYHWDFSDLNSTFKNFKGKKYKNAGTYNIRLITISSHNCSDTLLKTISVLPSPLANFSFGIACSRSLTPFTFTGLIPDTVISTRWFWQFQDGDTSSRKAPSKNLTKIGSNWVSLKLKSNNGCVDSITKEVMVLRQAKAEFTINDVCEDSASDFLNSSIDATHFKWKFGDGTFSNIKSPKHRYSIKGNSTTFNVTLVSSIDSGCSDSITKSTTVNAKPISDFSYKVNGDMLELIAMSKENTSYLWKFGNTDSVITNFPIYLHKLISQNQNKICLTATNASGCSSKSCQTILASVKKLEQYGAINIFPNPNTGSFYIEIENPTKDLIIEVFDNIGNLIQMVKCNPSSTRNLIILPSTVGVYNIRIKNGQEVYNRKIVVIN